MAKSSSNPSKTSPNRPSMGLGRGLSEIIAQGARSTNSAISSSAGSNHIREIPISQIVVNPRQPRHHFTEKPLDELTASIIEHGILQPITVRARENHFEIIAGERRFRACQKAGFLAIPAIVKSVSDIEAYQLALIENLQRENLDPIEEARGYQRLSHDFSMTQEQIAQKVGKNRATVANAMRLLDLPEEIHGYISANRLSAGHAKAILSLPDAEQQIHLAREAIKRGFNVRQTELWVSRIRPQSGTHKKKGSSPESSLKTSPHLRAIQNALQQKLATRVLVHTVGNGGRIEIQYYTPADLDRLLETLRIQL